jgi:hypothetical protein
VRVARRQLEDRKFQDFYGLKAGGEIDNQTLYALGQSGLAGPP